jgi:hypothetical protein
MVSTSSLLTCKASLGKSRNAVVEKKAGLLRVSRV